MARARKPGEAPLPPTRGPTDTPLYALLTARRFRLGASTERARLRLPERSPLYFLDISTAQPRARVIAEI